MKYVALVLTLIIAGEIYQEVPATFETMEDCQNYKSNNSLPEIFQCEVVEE